MPNAKISGHVETGVLHVYKHPKWTFLAVMRRSTVSCRDRFAIFNPISGESFCSFHFR